MKAPLAATLAILFVLHAAAQAQAQCSGWRAGPLDDGTLTNGADDTINASTAWDPDGAGPLASRIVVGGVFTSIGGVSALHVAQRDPATGQWQPLDTGIGANVNCLTVFNGELLAGCSGDNNVGTFDATVRRWDGAAWQSFPATNTGSVHVMYVYGGALYIGGSFMTHFTPGASGPAFYIARYNPGANLWDPVNEAGFGSQTGPVVYALASYNGELYVGGAKNSSTSITGIAAHVTHGNPPSAFTAITDGTDPGSVQDFDVFAGELIIAGGFLTLNGVTRHNIVAWNGAAFHSYSTGTGASGFESSYIYAVTIHNGIMIAGDFTTASGLPASHVAFWPPGGSAWQPVGGGTDDSVYDLLSYNSRLVAVGAFTVAERPAARIAFWDDVAWNSFGGGSGSYVLAMLNYRGRVVAGGDFHQSNADLNAAHHIAGWSGDEVQTLGSGMNGYVDALETFKYPGATGSYELIAGGVFTSAGGVPANRVARWDENPFIAFPPPAWQAMGAGFNNAVYALARYNGVTYAAGAFTASGATALNRIAKWNETTDAWEPLGSGVNGFVYALKVYNGNLYVGGNFSTAGGLSTGGLARWNGTSWGAVSTTLLDGVLAMEIYNNKLVIGGQFSAFPGNPNLIQFDGITFPFGFSALGAGGANNDVRALKVNGTRLYVGGGFTSLGGVAVNRIGYWDGSWHDTQYGTDNFVFALATFNNEVHVGGSFINVNFGGGFRPLHSPFWGRYTESGLPWFSMAPVGKTINLGDDVSFAAQLAAGFGSSTLQWYHNDVPMTDGPTGNGSTVGGAHALTLTILDTVFLDSGSYRLVATNGCGSTSTSPVILNFNPATAAPPAGSFTTVFEGLAPNPVAGASQLSFSLAHDAGVGVRVYNVAGRLVRHIDVGRLPAGRHMTRWDARDANGQRVAAGQYFVNLDVDGQQIGSKRLMVLH